jgi:hypothetical protein
MRDALRVNGEQQILRRCAPQDDNDSPNVILSEAKDLLFPHPPP